MGKGSRKKKMRSSGKVGGRRRTRKKKMRSSLTVMKLLPQERTRKKMKSSPTGMKVLPLDLVMNILSRLPLKTLFRFRCVSKQWLRLLTVDTHFIYNMHRPRLLTANSNTPNPSFISLQLYTVGTTHPCCYIEDAGREGVVKPTYLDFREDQSDHYYNFQGTCNGLVCLAQYTSTETVADLPSKLLVWNPLTSGDYFTLSCFGTSPSTFGPSRAIFGFGFHHAANQYKVVKILFSTGGVSPPHISVLTLGTETWRNLGILCYNFTCCDFPVTINGSPHWLVLRSGTKHYLIVGFDVEDEVFQEISLPIQVQNEQLCPKIKEFGGLLYMIVDTLQKEIEIWVMKEHGVPSSWIKQFIIRKTWIFKIDCWEPVGIACNGEVAFRRGDDRRMELLLYNPKTNSFKDPTKFKFNFDEVFTFAGSLISPKVINGGDTQRTLMDKAHIDI